MIPAFSYQMTLTHGLCDLFTGTEPRKTKNERSQLINPRAQIATAAVVELHQNVRPDTAELPGRVEPNKSGAGERVHKTGTEKCCAFWVLNTFKNWNH